MRANGVVRWTGSAAALALVAACSTSPSGAADAGRDAASLADTALGPDAGRDAATSDPDAAGAPDTALPDAAANPTSARCTDLPATVQGAATGRIGFTATLVCGTPDGATCTLTNDTRTTGPGACPSDLQTVLVGWNGTSGEVALGATGWTAVSSTAGTVVSNMGVTDIPADTDASIVLSSPSAATYTIVVRISSGDAIHVESYVLD